MEEYEAWLPDESIYLEKADAPVVRPGRPWNQGDIFDAPSVLLKKPGSDTEAPPESRASSKTDLVALLGHPCSIRGGGGLAVLQNVAHVRPAKDGERAKFEEVAEEGRHWEAYYKVFPLPDLRDGELWVADFNIISTLHFKHLTDQRIACLSKEGWAAFQIRYSWHSLRIRPAYDARLNDLTETWNELEIWEEWNSRGFEEREFQDSWLEGELGGDSQYAGTKRRDLLILGPDLLVEDLPDP
jgi:hypothetical protein